jgi:small subunit ribosomal protein S19
MIDHTIVVCSGREHLPIYVINRMVDHKLGKFAPTLLFQGHARNNKKYCRN